MLTLYEKVLDEIYFSFLFFFFSTFFEVGLSPWKKGQLCHTKMFKTHVKESRHHNHQTPVTHSSSAMQCADPHQPAPSDAPLYSRPLYQQIWKGVAFLWFELIKLVKQSDSNEGRPRGSVLPVAGNLSLQWRSAKVECGLPDLWNDKNPERHTPRWPC